MKRFILCVAALVAFRSPLCAQQRWIEVRSAHFSVLTDAGEDQARDLVMRFEQMRLLFGQLLLNHREVQSAPVKIVALSNINQLREYALLMDQDASWKGSVVDSGDIVQGAPSEAPPQPPGKYGYPVERDMLRHDSVKVYLHSQDEDYVVLDLDSKFGWEPVFHEYAHRLLESNFAPLPAWFAEGFAEYFSAIRLEGNHAVTGIPEGPGSAFRHDRPLSVAALVNMNLSSVDDRLRLRFNAASWLLVSYLFQHHQIEQAQKYFELVDKGATATDAIKQAFGMPASELDEQLAQQLHQKKNRESIPLQHPAREGIAGAEVPAITAEAILADVHLHEPGYHSTAVREFEAVLKQDPENAIAHRGLGLDRLRYRDLAAAAMHLQQAANKNPDDWLTHYYQALLLDRKHDLSLAPQIEEHARQVTRLNPQFADGFAVLGSALAGRKKTADSAAAYIQALRLSPGNENYALNLANVYFAQDKVKEAKAVVSSLQHSSNAGIASAARSFLKDIDELARLGKD